MATTWYDTTWIPSKDLNCTIAYGGGTFVVSKYNSPNIFASSDNGITWVSRPIPTDTFKCITFGGGRFVALSTTRVIVSADASPTTTWTSFPLPTPLYTWSSVTYAVVAGNGVFVAVSVDNKVLTSPNGSVWTLNLLPITNHNSRWSSVTFGNGIFVAVAGAGTRVMTSPDGMTWTQRHLLSTQNLEWNSVAFGGGVFVAVSGPVAGTNDRVMTSTDGITWTLRNSLIPPPAIPPAGIRRYQWYSIAFVGGEFVAVGVRNAVGTSMRSVDSGVTWTEMTMAPGVAAGGGLWSSVAAGAPTVFLALSLFTGDASFSTIPPPPPLPPPASTPSVKVFPRIPEIDPLEASLRSSTEEASRFGTPFLWWAILFFILLVWCLIWYFST